MVAERTLATCLPVEICQWRQGEGVEGTLLPVTQAQTGTAREGSPGAPVLVQVESQAPAEVAEAQEAEEVVASVGQCAPLAGIKSNCAIRSWPEDRV
jgi:hypothetical protein